MASARRNAGLRVSPAPVALAWLLQRSPDILIPGISSLAHLRDNLEAATLGIPSDVLANLNANRGVRNPRRSIIPR